MKNLAWITALLLLSVLSGCASYSHKSASRSHAITEFTPTYEENLTHDQQLADVLFVPGVGFSFLNTLNPEKCDAQDYIEWKELNALFNQKGFNLHVACIPSIASIENLATELKDDIEKKFPAAEKRKFHIIAKSMGGLAVRQVLSDAYKENRSLSDQVITFTTISTPHKGSYIANMLMQGEFCTIPGNILSFFRSFFPDDPDGYGFAAAGADLTTYSKFRELYVNKKIENDLKIKDDPEIYKRAFSYGYAIDCDANCRSKYHDRKTIPSLIIHCWHDAMVKNLELNYDPENGDLNTQNDGLVTVESAMYGKYVDTFEGDHMALTEKGWLYKGKPIWKDVFSKVLDNIKEKN